MSNKRIDLTQFEGIPKRMETEWHEHPIYGARYLIQICEPETPWVVGTVVPDFGPSGDYAKDKAEQEKMAKIFAAVPDLIAELKRCYEELDEFDKLVGLLIENHFVETSPYETVKHLIETHQDYIASE